MAYYEICTVKDLTIVEDNIVKAPYGYTHSTWVGFDDEKSLIYKVDTLVKGCLLYTSPSPRDKRQSRMPSSA